MKEEPSPREGKSKRSHKGGGGKPGGDAEGAGRLKTPVKLDVNGGGGAAAAEQVASLDTSDFERMWHI